MTKEKLKQEAEKFARTEMSHPNEYGMYYCTFLKVAEPREKQIQIDAEYIRALQKDKGRLTDKVKELEDKIKHLTQHLEPQSMSALFEQVEEEVKQKQRIEELEKQISILLSCKDCADNKGGYICVKEYNDKCLAQKIQHIKELQEENAKLQHKVDTLQGFLDRDVGFDNLQKENAELKERNAELKEKYDTCLRENTGLKIHNAYVEKKLTEAKEIMSSMLNAMKRLNVYKTQGGIMDKAEAFLKE